MSDFKRMGQTLSEQELDFLSEFLLDRCDEPNYEYQEDVDEGILDISELDGYLTAIASGPDLIQPSQWLPRLWGDLEPEFQSEKMFEQVFSLLIRHMNSIATLLMEQPADFEPAFGYRDIDDQTHYIVDEWCEGYMRGIDLSPQSWCLDDLNMRILLAPISAYTERKNWPGHDLATPEMVNLQKAIVPNVREIHAFWLQRRGVENGSVSQTFRHQKPRVGRNDPCPCGSGKKYKKCCLH